MLNETFSVFFKHCANGFKNEIMYRIFAVSSYFVGYESTEGWGTIKRANLSVKLRCPATLLPKGSMTLLCVTNAVQGLNMKGWTRLLRSYTLFCGQGEMISLKQKTFNIALQRKGYKAQCLKIAKKSHFTTLRAKRATFTFHWSKSVTRHANFNRTKISEKSQS